MKAIAQEDFGSFPQDPVDPKAQAEKEKKAKAEQERLFKEAIKLEKANATKKAPPKKAPAEKAPKEAAADMEKSAAARAKLMQRYLDYEKFLHEYHPERVVFLNLPQNPAKLSEEELSMLIKLIESDLGKKASMDLVVMGFVQLMKIAEQTEHIHKQPLKGAEAAAVRMCTPQKHPDGHVVPGPAIPTLAEFAAKYSYIFSTGVEIRLALLISNTLISVRNANLAMQETGQMPPQQKPSVVPKDKMEAL